MKKVIGPGVLIPPFYGIAYMDHLNNKSICYPLFINLIVILWRDIIWWLKDPKGGF